MTTRTEEDARLADSEGCRAFPRRTIASRPAVGAGFTLIELLVVVAIIVLLLAILLPSLARVRRAAIVLASPIAYIDKNGELWVCGPEGEHQLKVSSLCGFYGSVKWSPLGTRIACNYDGRMAIVNPVTGHVDLLPQDYLWPIWIDSDNILAQHEYGGWSYDLDLYVVKVPTGDRVLFRRLKRDGLPWGQVTGEYCANTGMADGFVISEAEYNWSPATDVVIRRRNWTLAKTIWNDAQGPWDGGNMMDFEPRVDQLGEYVAWSRGRGQGPYTSFGIAIKALAAPSSQPPTMIGTQFDNAWFCDWTTDNNLLAVVTQNGRTNLAIMNRRGQIARTIPIPQGIAKGLAFSNAAWRRYEHR